MTPEEMFRGGELLSRIPDGPTSGQTQPTTDPAALLGPLLDIASAHGHAMPDLAWVVEGFLLESRCPCGCYVSAMRLAGEWTIDTWAEAEECQCPPPDPDSALEDWIENAARREML